MSGLFVLAAFLFIGVVSVLFSKRVVRERTGKIRQSTIVNRGNVIYLRRR